MFSTTERMASSVIQGIQALQRLFQHAAEQQPGLASTHSKGVCRRQRRPAYLRRVWRTIGNWTEPASVMLSLSHSRVLSCPQLGPLKAPIAPLSRSYLAPNRASYRAPIAPPAHASNASTARDSWTRPTPLSLSSSSALRT